MSTNQTVKKDDIKYWQVPVLGGIDLLSAECIKHRFSRHAHEEFVLAVFERGAEQFEAQDATLTAKAGSVLIIPPGVAHTGQAASNDGWSYRAIYPRSDLVHQISADLFHGKPAFDRMPVGLLSDTGLYNRFLETHKSFSESGNDFDKEVELIRVLGELLTCMLPTKDIRNPGHENRAVEIAREFIDAHYFEPISGSEVAASVELSLPHLMRSFYAQMGVPINVYLTSVRLSHARKLLLKGKPAAEVALEVGFVDQSHLIRRFKDAFGVTPGQYVRFSKTQTRQ
ncbi:AraC family transcriptional regulator [Motiliproteus sp. MSK22-1]|uniref:AraC family transcriptional regulator n=1 Tax=Motiliproteus sp. MSK22-1 TaxID=1897630 RepID=UPI00097866F9|nr:AraC family transcriptional regulator [Motiliproteus sp. MSK22-1]OMH30805.1 hypothetical protein BGP75_17420 [Motiliproteus sp. MSK22-1]